ncbi:glutaredoxin 2 [Neisseria sp. ZJ106]|uniref:Glutaredoxin 2 n=1 Tax=Neisseria lisongii TaxID=2912188 RepID=A0ABY7RII5_9NEIS|nr:glutaredoxin 2 [Neisseria lisongii]MCF7521535.1 glutaredoxin 2 [Neisseria lisongii]WCL71036.1 glutaredoxin 2 [Neisseria lisongii]
MKLYIYDHCPFCVRARMIFGLCGVAVENVILANDDETTPISMIGAKQVPILEKDDGSFMGESLDIVAYIDRLGGKGRLKSEIRSDIQAWFDKVSGYYNHLVQPRMVKLDLPEFATESAVAYFVGKKEKTIGNFAVNLERSGKYLKRIHEDLAELEQLITPNSDGLGGEPGMEDILIFPILRNLSMVNGIRFPERTLAYLNKMSGQSAVPLYFAQAC